MNRFAVVSLTALLTGLSWHAYATPMTLTITAEDLTTSTSFTQTYTDSATPNEINIPAGSVGAINFTGEQAISTVGPPTNVLLTSALTITNSSADPYAVSATLSGLNFAGPAAGVALTASGSWLNTAGSIMTLNWYNDPTDAGLMGAAQRVGTFTSSAAVGSTSSYSYTPGESALATPDTGPFSMAETWNYTLAAGGELVSRGQTETETTAVPEPSSAPLLASGMVLLMLGAVTQRQRRF
jgi:hypothetical protein